MESKPLRWLGASLANVRVFPEEARREAGFELGEVQKGFEPSDWMPMANIGAGAKEIRIHAENEYRVIYVAKFAEAVYVLHAFAKKTPRTAQTDIALAAKRYRELLQERN